jgi:hypothetical protein
VLTRTPENVSHDLDCWPRQRRSDRIGSERIGTDRIACFCSAVAPRRTLQPPPSLSSCVHTQNILVVLLLGWLCKNYDRSSEQFVCRLREKHGSTSRIVNVFRFSFVTITKHILHPSVCQDTMKQQIHTSH